MDDRTKAWLYDILSAIQDTDSFLEDNTKNYHNFSINLCVKRALERNLEIIGIALQNLMNYLPELKFSHADMIIDTASRIRSSDDPVSKEILKNIIIKYLPKLRDELHLMIIQSY